MLQLFPDRSALLYTIQCTVLIYTVYTVTHNMEITEKEDATALPGQVVITLYYTVYSTHAHSVHNDLQHGDHGNGGCVPD